MDKEKIWNLCKEVPYERYINFPVEINTMIELTLPVNSLVVTEGNWLTAGGYIIVLNERLYAGPKYSPGETRCGNTSADRIGYWIIILSCILFSVHCSVRCREMEYNEIHLRGSVDALREKVYEYGLIIDRLTALKNPKL